MQQVKWRIKVTVSRDFGLWLIFQCNPPMYCTVRPWAGVSEILMEQIVWSSLIYSQLLECWVHGTKGEVGVLGGEWWRGQNMCFVNTFVSKLKIYQSMTYTLILCYLLPPTPPPTTHLEKRDELTYTLCLHKHFKGTWKQQPEKCQSNN